MTLRSVGTTRNPRAKMMPANQEDVGRGAGVANAANAAIAEGGGAAEVVEATVAAAEAVVAEAADAGVEAAVDET